jgi:trigger factor
MAVHEYEGPDLEEFAKTSGKESLTAWTEEVKADLLKEKESGIDRQVEERVIRKVVDATTIELPEKFSRRRASELVQQEAYRMYQGGAGDEEVRAFLDQSKDKGLDDVKTGLKRAFIVDAIARKERVIVTEDEISREIAKLAAAIGRDGDELKADLRARGTLDGMREEMKSNKVLSLLRQKAKYE